MTSTQQTVPVSGSGPDTLIADASSNDICRDFLRHVCKRGRRCRYRHPESAGSTVSPPPALSSSSTESSPTAAAALLVFCHDYQNGGCQRPACRFIHCSREEEAIFRATGRLPDRLLAGLPADLLSFAQIGSDEPPVCKDHLKGECKRGARCRFRHLDAAPTAAAGSLTSQGAAAAAAWTAAASMPTLLLPPDFLTQAAASSLDPSAMLMMLSSGVGLGDAPLLKRRRLEFETQQPQQHLPPLTFLQAAQQPPLPPVPPPGLALDPTVSALQAENATLRRRLEELRRQCLELTATNELLSQHNARLRQQQMPLVPSSAQQQHQLDAALSTAAAVSFAGLGDFAAAGLPTAQPIFAYPQAQQQQQQQQQQQVGGLQPSLVNTNKPVVQLNQLQ